MLDWLTQLLWGWHVLLLLLGAGAYFTAATGFYQVRCLGRWLGAALASRRKGEGEEEGGKLSSFQALTAALAGSLGTGNIVGVGVAIATGGAGALFWMWASALLGMMTVYAENVLAARHRQAPGALGYIRAAGRWGKPLAAVYAGGCCLSSLGMGTMAQTNSAAASLSTLGVPVAASALGLGLLAFWVARGGLALGAKITQRLVPLMTLLFFGASLWVLWVFRENIPRAFASVFQGAFSLKAGAGGAAGALLALRTGVSRGVFTNEAGLGSSAFAYQEVEGRSPEELGCLGIFQVFVDTLVMCTVTGLCILCCRSPVLEGGQLAFYAFESALGPWGGRVASLCTALFALATLVAWCCWGREGLFYLTGSRGRTPYALAAGAAAALGCLLPLGTVFQLGDACNGLMALPNVAALFLLRREAAGVCRRGGEGPSKGRRGKKSWGRFHKILKTAGIFSNLMVK